MRRPGFVSAKKTMMAFAVLLLLTGAYQAAVSVADGAGRLLTVEVVQDTVDPAVQGLALRDQGPLGTSVENILSTFDPIIDAGPDLAINPYDGQPVIVWSRQAGADFEIAMIRRQSGGWGPIDFLTGNTTSDIEPKLIVDLLERAHIVWYPSGIGGPVYLQSFDVRNGHADGPPARPLEPTVTRPLRSNVTGGSDVGGGDDPGLIGGFTAHASVNECTVNPAAAPEHGALLACGIPAAYQLSSCTLVVGVYDTAHAVWAQTISDLSLQSFENTTVRDIAQAIAEARCN